MGLSPNATPTIVVKLGTTTLTGGTRRLSRPHMVEIVRQIAALRADGLRVVVVSSGAIAAGREVLGDPAVANHLPAKQMLSAVGQSYLMQVYRMLFDLYGVPIGQVLLTHDDLSHRTRYLNARATLNTLLDYGIVPIVNENDTVAVEEIKVGDNVNLSALVAVLLSARQPDQHVGRGTAGDKGPRAATDRQPRRLNLRLHPADAQSGHTLPGQRFNRIVNLGDLMQQACVGMDARVAVVQPFLVGQQNQRRGG